MKYWDKSTIPYTAGDRQVIYYELRPDSTAVELHRRFTGDPEPQWPEVGQPLVFNDHVYRVAQIQFSGWPVWVRCESAE